MASRQTSRSSIIYQNTAQTIALIDIPQSIAAAQGRTDTLLSTTPLEAPIEPREDYQPKSQRAKGKAKAAVAHHPPSHGSHHVEYKALIKQALKEIHAHVSGQWCRPRRLLEPNSEHAHSMEIDDPEKELDSCLRQWAAAAERKGVDTAFDLQQMMASLGSAASEDVATGQQVVSQGWIAATVSRNEPRREPWTSTFHNPMPSSLELTISKSVTPDSPPGQEYRFTIPPCSTIFLSDTAHSESFRAAFREVTDEYTLPRHFNLVLLDPPWPNRSVKRKQGTYDQVGGMPYLRKMLLRMDLDSYMEHNALVGVWITNKEALRQHVLGPGGLFETWNVGLIEEWVWIKTTTRGEPMFDIDNGMRKPYEVLLLGRTAPNAWTTMAHAPDVKRRVIAAVPDVHSRKPCLKEMLESYLPADYSALEVFSRYLVSGWTSWGNEALKYQWDFYWASEPGDEVRNVHQLPFRMG
ncbi:MT-A70-domain-containing protein [Phaeosphaeria sp. MPI-PUGE-AT-0046c]|nr:MT-A70-domain-containing protein [Phaeosphaeria sp. MPI-PUGE-AT-0046c]